MAQSPEREIELGGVQYDSSSAHEYLPALNFLPGIFQCNSSVKDNMIFSTILVHHKITLPHELEPVSGNRLFQNMFSLGMWNHLK